MRAIVLCALLLPPLLGALCGCQRPLPEAYVGGSGTRHGAATPLGVNASGEACEWIPGQSGGDVFCGAWEHPSGRIQIFAASAGATAAAAAGAGSPWRAALDERFLCAPPVAVTIAGELPAARLDCSRRVGGWPQVGLVAIIDGRAYAADGILPAETVLQRGIGAASGRLRADRFGGARRPDDAALRAARLAHASFTEGDVEAYQRLMDNGTWANLSQNFRAAEDAFRRALDIQRAALGEHAPAIAATLAHVALQASDQGHASEAAALFAEARQLSQQAGNPLTQALLLHYRGLDAINRQSWSHALGLLQQAEQAYAAQLEPGDLSRRAPVADAARGGATDAAAAASLLGSSARASALIGVIEVRRNEAKVLDEMGRGAESVEVGQSAAALARAERLLQPGLAARVYRTLAIRAAARGDGRGAAAQLAQSEDAFIISQHGQLPVAETALLQAGQAYGRHDLASALVHCRAAAALLRELKAGVRPDLLAPCLDALAAVPGGGRLQADAAAEMFALSQLGRGSSTAQQIALAVARLREQARDPRVSEAIRRWQDATVELNDLRGLQAQVEKREARQAAGRDAAAGEAPLPDAAEVRRRVAAAALAVRDANAALQEASPRYGELVQDSISASDALAALRPHEALASIFLGPQRGWTFLLRGGRVSAHPVPLGLADIADLVKRIRAAMQPEPGSDGRLAPAAFDTDAAFRLYAALFGASGPPLEGIDSLVVAPTGPLLSIPFALLLTAPVAPAHLEEAQWLIRAMAVTHVPAPANFVGLRRVAGRSLAARPWFGFGGFQDVTRAQARRSFPPDRCSNSASALANAAPLPYFAEALTASRQLVGAAATEALLGRAFTAAAVQRQALSRYRVLEFASHGLLPTDLPCEPEPAILTSAPANAADASGALLTASQIARLDLDADAVIVAACNSAGPDGSGGEGLSGLARAFFFAGARALMVAHWEVDEWPGALLMLGTLERYHGGAAGGFSGALRAAELSFLDRDARTEPRFRHPFFWAPFALIGDSGEPPAPGAQDQAALDDAPPAGGAVPIR